MVICKERKFIFLRVPKNASTSLATFFVQGYCDSNDIYTGIGDSKITRQNIPDAVHSKYRQGYRIIHLTLNEILHNNLLDESFARQCKIFGVLRDPFDRQLSLYFFKNRRRGNVSPKGFRQMFRNGYCNGDLNNQILQSDYLKIGDQSVGEWWLYDTLNQHLAEFQQQYPPTTNVDLPQYKSSFRKSVDKQALIDEYYDDETRQAVAEYYANDIDLYQRLKNVEP